jgi:hypothetical protein
VLVVEGTKIVAVGKRGEVAIPEGADIQRGEKMGTSHVLDNRLVQVHPSIFTHGRNRG